MSKRLHPSVNKPYSGARNQLYNLSVLIHLGPGRTKLTLEELHQVFINKYLSFTQFQFNQASHVGARNQNEPSCSMRGILTFSDKTEYDRLIQKSLTTHQIQIEAGIEISLEKKKKKESNLQRKVFVHNIPKKIGNKELRMAFSKFGAVDKVFLINRMLTKSQKFNKGFVIFEQSRSAIEAIERSWIMVEKYKILIVKPKTKREIGMSTAHHHHPYHKIREPYERGKFCGPISWGDQKGDYRAIVSVLQIAKRRKFAQNHSYWNNNIAFRRTLSRYFDGKFRWGSSTCSSDES